ncbi:MAG: hypothetical protein IJB47_03250 [Oscillospiraceae bacterium]|nr:hypothetical protein [Oscillospiraceae bacterium]
MVCLGVDIGGTGCKCVAFRDDGMQLALRYLEFPNPPGKVDLSSDVLRESVFRVIEQCVSDLADPKEVAAITVSSFGESFVPVDRQGAPLTDVILYFANSESAEFDAVVEKVGADQIMEITRTLPDASYSLSKMLYTKHIAERPVWKYLFVASYLTFCLSGEAVCGEALACRSLLYDVKNRAWSKYILDIAGIDEEQLPDVRPDGVVVGTLLPHLADRFSLSRDVCIVNCCHDQIVNALGAGVCKCGDAVDTTGTSECITPLFPDIPGMDFTKNNYACIPYLDNLGYVTYAYNISGGSVVKWYRDALAAHLRQQAQEENCSIYDLLNRTCPDKPTDLLVLPFLQGMGGTPEVNPNATGLIAGLTTKTTLPELYRAILEGLCFEMQYNLERLSGCGIHPTRLYACGGGAQSPVWLQIKADVWGLEIIPVKTKETGALGCAIMGFAAMTKADSVCNLATQFTQHGQTILPNPEHHKHYQKQYEKYCKFRELVKLY